MGNLLILFPDQYAEKGILYYCKPCISRRRSILAFLLNHIREEIRIDLLFYIIHVANAYRQPFFLLLNAEEGMSKIILQINKRNSSPGHRGTFLDNVLCKLHGHSYPFQQMVTKFV